MGRQLIKIIAICIVAVSLCFMGVAGAAEAEKPPIKVGAIFSVTGPAAFLGGPEQKTAEMLVEKINKEGGVDGQKIELIVKDSGGKPENAISLAKQLIEEQKVLAIIGPSTSGETMAIKNICGGQDHTAFLCGSRRHCQSGGQLCFQDAAERQRRSQAHFTGYEGKRHKENRRDYKQ